MRSPGYLCVLAIFWPSIAWPERVPYRFRKAVRARAGAVRALEQPTASLADQYEANTGPVESTCMGVFWTTHDSLRAQNHRKPIFESCICSSFSHGLYTAPYGSKNQRKIVRFTAARLSAQSDHGFRYALNWQTELGAHAVSVLSCTGSQISCYVFSQQLHALKQTELKLHVLRQWIMKNENKNVTFTNNVFYRNGLSAQRHLWGIKCIFTIPCAIIMLQIQHIEFLLTAIAVFSNETC